MSGHKDIVDVFDPVKSMVEPFANKKRISIRDFSSSRVKSSQIKKSRKIKLDSIREIRLSYTESS